MLSWSALLARRSRRGDAARYWGRLRSTETHCGGTQCMPLSAAAVRVSATRRLPVPYSIAQGHLGRPSVTELHGSHAASCLASQSGAQATSPMEGMVSTTSRLGVWPGGPRTDRYGHAQYEFSYRAPTRKKAAPSSSGGSAQHHPGESVCFYGAAARICFGTSMTYICLPALGSCVESMQIEWPSRLQRGWRSLRVCGGPSP